MAEGAKRNPIPNHSRLGRLVQAAAWPVGRVLWTVALVTALWLPHLLIPHQVAQGQDNPDPGEPPQPLDVVLLMDGSISMGNTDPDRLRETAADYLVDFLAANSETVGINYRLGAAAFSEELFPYAVPLDPVPVDLTSIQGLTPSGDTDFRPAFDYALKELRPSFDSGRQMAVVLFTDGQPRIDSQEVADPDGYFEELGEQVAALEAEGVRVFVVGIGNALLDQERWERILGPGHFEPIIAPRDLYQVYSQWFSELIGLSAVGDAERLESGRAESFTLQPFLEHVIVTVIKDDPSVVLNLRQPDGSVFEISPEEQDKAYVVYNIDDPVGGMWELSASGGGVDYYVWKSQPSLRLAAEPSQPAIGSSLSVEIDNLSDRLQEAGENLQLELHLSASDRTFITPLPMELQPDGSYSGTLRRTGGIAPGTYDLELEALIDNEPVPLAYQPLVLTFVVPPKIGAVHIDGRPVSEADGALEVEPDQTLNVSVEVTQADLLSDDLQLFFVRPSGELSEFNVEEFEEDTTAGSRIYTADIPILADQVNGNLVIQLRGTTAAGADFVDYDITRLMQRPLPPTVVPTLPPTVIPVSPVPPTTTPQPEISTSAYLPARILIVVVLTIILIIVGFVITRKPLSSKDLSNALDGLKNALETGNRPEGIKVVKVYLDAKNAVLSETIEPVIQETEVVFENFLKLYKKGGKIEWEKFYEDICKLFSHVTENRSIHLRSLARFLFSDAVWGSEEPFFAVKGLYQLLQQGLPAAEFVTILAKEDRTIVRSRLFGALANAIRYPSAANFATVKKFSDSLPGAASEAYSGVYNQLSIFYRAPTFTIDDSFKTSIRGLRGKGPDVLAVLFQDVGDKLANITRPRYEEQFAKVTKQLEDAVATITEQPRYRQIPEAEFLKRRIYDWIQVADQEKQLLFKRRDDIPVKEGGLLLEARPTLDLFESHEKRDINGSWKRLKIPVVVYRTGETAVTEAKVYPTLQDIDMERVLELGPHRSVQFEFFNDEHQYEQTTIDLTDYIAGPTKVQLRTTYTTQEVKAQGASFSPKQITQGVDKPIILGLVAHYVAPSELKMPYVPDEPLTAHELDNLHLSLTLPEEMLQYVRQRGGGIQLISLRGLRRSGKTTNLRAFRRKLDELRSQSRLPGDRFITVEIDLMVWWNKEIPVHSSRPPAPEALEISFWIALLKRIAKEVGRADVKQGIEIASALQALGDELKKGTRDLKTIQQDFFKQIKQLRQKDKSRLMLLFEEADLFAYFGNETLYRALTKLSKQTNTTIVLCHDAYDAPWFLTLTRVFTEEANRQSDRLLDQRNIFHPQEYRTFMFGKQQTFDLLDRGSLKFTDLAKETAWVLTGGYVSLIQLLCYYLTTVRREEAEARIQAVGVQIADQAQSLGPATGSHSMETGMENDQAVYVTVTADDVKDVAYTFSAEFISMVAYLGQSFSPAEYLLMLSIARYHLDLETGILKRIRYEEGAADRPRWEGLEELIHDTTEQYPGKLAKESFVWLLNQLLEKQVLERVVVEEKPLSLVRWRVGWLVRYVRDSANHDLQPLLDEIKPMERAVTV